MWAALLAAIAVHGTVLGTVQAFGVSMIGKGLGARTSSKPAPAVDEAELKASCLGDVMFASSGRTALCFAPWIADVDQCLSDAQMSLWIDLSACQARNDPSTAIAMIEARTADRMKPIDPERLLLEEAQPDKPKPPAPQLAEQQPATAAPPPPPPPPQQQRPQQVIETVKPSDEKEPENARFLSEYNTRVDKEQVARGARNEPMVAKSKPEELTPKDKPKDDPAVKQLEPDRVAGRNERAPDVPGNLSMRKPGAPAPGQVQEEARVRGATDGKAPSKDSSEDGYLARKGDGAIDQQRQDRSEVASGQGGAGGGAPRVPNLKPSAEALERALGGGSVDHLENVADGEETALSSKRWVYASFFNRLKRQVAQNWDPERVWRQSDPNGTRYGTKTRITEVRVSLSSRGELAKIVVTTPSGVNELDGEAVRAFKSAAPFANPPAGLVQKDNLITFAFSFFFEIGSPRVTWRLPQAM